MSVESMTKALKLTELSGTKKLVLIGIANHDGDGGAWPSVATLAVYASASTRTVQRAITDLESEGWITVHKNAGGSASTRSDRRPNLYELHLDHRAINGVTSADGVTSSAPRGDIQGPDGVTSSAPRGDIAVSPEPSMNHPDEPSVNASRNDLSLWVETRNPHETFALCMEFVDSIERRGNKRPTITKAWADDMDRLQRIDGRTPDDIRRVIAWLEAGRDDVARFWAPNIRSPRKLREKWDQMREQHERSRSTVRKSSPGMDRLREIHERGDQ